MLRRMSRPVSILLGLFVLVGVFAGLSLLSAAPDGGKKYALVVGINNYDHAKLPNLKYAENDAAALGDVLRKAGYEVIVLSGAEGKNDATRQPTKENIDKSLAALLKKYQKGDTILLAFAGHGLQFDKECYFCPRDAKPFKDKTESLVALSKVYHELEAAFDGTKIMLVDACRNDPDPGRGSRGIDADSAAPPPKGVAALFSCSANERAYESDELKHGVFFHCVLEALQGKGGTNDKGEVTWSRLTEYVPDKVEAQIPKLIGREFKQTPNMKADLAGRSPVLVRLDKEKPNDTVIKDKEKPDDTVVKDQPKTLTVEIDGMKMEFVLIPKGKFKMGSPKDEAERNPFEKDFDAERLHEVEISKPFYLGKYPVTQKQYDAIVKENPSWFQAGKGGAEKVKGLDTDQFPVETVSWDDAQTFCKKMKDKDKQSRKFRLPTEAEWEYACRAGTTTPFYFGSKLNGKEANCDGNYPYGTTDKGPYKERTTKVGAYDANKWGLYDMHGNVWQWCEDYYGPYNDDLKSTDPLRSAKHSEERRVLRGGSWDLTPGDCRAAYRGRCAPDNRIDCIGFRVAFRLD